MFAIVCQYAESVSFPPQFDLLMTAINSSYLKSFLEHLGEKRTGKVTFTIGRLFLVMISFESGSPAWIVVTAREGVAVADGVPNQTSCRAQLRSEGLHPAQGAFKESSQSR